MNGGLLYGLLNNVSIGNGTVYNFVDYIGEMHISPGIKVYSQNYGFMESNIFNNFNGGKVGRYNYGRGGKTEETTNNGSFLDNVRMKPVESKLYSTDGVKLDNGKLVHADMPNDRIGEYYTVGEFSSNASLKFMDEYEFTDLNKLIRDSLLLYNYNEAFFKNRYYEEADKFTSSNKMRYDVKAGDDDAVDVNSTLRGARLSSVLPNEGSVRASTLDKAYESFRDKAIHASKMALIGKKNLNFYSKMSPVITENITIGNDLMDYGNIFREKLLPTSILHEYLKNFPNSTDSIGIDTEIEYKNNVSALTKDLASKYSSSFRGTLLTDMSKFLTVKELYKKYASKYSSILATNVEYYSINTENKYNGVSESPLPVGGSLVTKFGRNKTYTYFQEPDGAQETSIQKSSTHDSFVPKMDSSSFSSASNLLQKTNELFKKCKIKSLINRFHTDVVINDELTTSYSEYGMSRGRNLLKASGTDKSTGYDNPYCRVWTAHHQYSKMGDRIRPFMNGDTPLTISEVQSLAGKEFRPNNGGKHLEAYGVLQNNGFLRITSQKDDSGVFEFENKRNLTRYMFSIENLAWKGDESFLNLPTDQRGPNGGRIMWFPPYNLSFSENINVTWKDNDFIGRGEKIYTYVNTERGGTLEFTLLIDHPSVLDKWRGPSRAVNNPDEAEQDLLRFFAGCGTIGTVDSGEEEPKEEYTADMTEPSEEPEMCAQDAKTIVYFLFFANNFSGYDYKGSELEEKLSEYEMTGGGQIIDESDQSFEDEVLQEQNKHDQNLFGLNKTTMFQAKQDKALELIPHLHNKNNGEDFIDVDTFEGLKAIGKKYGWNNKYFDFDGNEFEVDYIDIYGFASSHGSDENNDTLTRRRQNTIKAEIIHLLPGIETDLFIEDDNRSIIPVSTDDINELDSKIARSAAAVFHLKLKDDAKPKSTSENQGTSTSVSGEIPFGSHVEKYLEQLNNLYTKTTINDIESNSESDEYLYFSKVLDNDKFIYNNIVDKVKYFDPAFHSMTPEGFNGRLSFLHQCTRQGPTKGAGASGIDKYTQQAANLAFGRPPYCILRIGDFYNTKIIVQSLSISYDNDGIRWDLNPEGAGVQPMMAKINMTIQFLGGQDIGGTVQELQNAISENYYANTSIFNKRSTRITQ